jgi:hypothetical protein
MGCVPKRIPRKGMTMVSEKSEKTMLTRLRDTTPAARAR